MFVVIQCKTNGWLEDWFNRHRTHTIESWLYFFEPEVPNVLTFNWYSLCILFANRLCLTCNKGFSSFFFRKKGVKSKSVRKFEENRMLCQKVQRQNKCSVKDAYLKNAKGFNWAFCKNENVDKKCERMPEQIELKRERTKCCENVLKSAV